MAKLISENNPQRVTLRAGSPPEFFGPGSIGIGFLYLLDYWQRNTSPLQEEITIGRAPYPALPASASRQPAANAEDQFFAIQASEPRDHLWIATDSTIRRHTLADDGNVVGENLRINISRLELAGAMPDSMRIDGDVLYARYTGSTMVRAFDFSTRAISASLSDTLPRLASQDFELAANVGNEQWDVKTYGEERYIVSVSSLGVSLNDELILGDFNVLGGGLSSGVQQPEGVALNQSGSLGPSIILSTSILYSVATPTSASADIYVAAITQDGEIITQYQRINWATYNHSFGDFPRPREFRGLSFAQSDRTQGNVSGKIAPSVSNGVLVRRIGHSASHITRAEGDGDTSVFRERRETLVEIQLTNVDDIFLLNQEWFFEYGGLVYIMQEMTSDTETTTATFSVN